jgi:hypothetical protein
VKFIDIVSFGTMSLSYKENMDYYELEHSEVTPKSAWHSSFERMQIHY